MTRRQPGSAAVELASSRRMSWRFASHLHGYANWNPGKGWDHLGLAFIVRLAAKGTYYTIRQGTKPDFFAGIVWPCVETAVKYNYDDQFWGFSRALPVLQSCCLGWLCLHSSAGLRNLRVWQNCRATKPGKLVLVNVFLSEAKGTVWFPTSSEVSEDLK